MPTFISSAAICVCIVAVTDDEDEQLSIVSRPGGGVALDRYDLPCPLKGIVF